MTDLDSRLRGADPARDLPPYATDASERLLTSVTEGDATGAPHRRGGQRALRLAIAVLAIALVVPLMWLAFPGSATATASDLLERARVAAIDPPARGDQYWRIELRSVTTAPIGEGDFSLGDPTTTAGLRQSNRVMWVAVDGSRPTWFSDRTGPWVRQIQGPAVALPEVGWGEPDAWTTDASPADSVGERRVMTLPTDPTLLRAQLYAQAFGRGQNLDGQVVDDIAGLLMTGLPSAAQRQALFGVLKTVPGVDVVADDFTLDGRRGVALGRRVAGENWGRELIFDPSTGELIGERIIMEFLPGAPSIDTALRRTLVDGVDADVQAQAARFVCRDENGVQLCRKG